MARASLPVLLALLAASVLQTLALRLGNTLHANGRWESTKVGLDHGILGAVSFVATRTALHGIASTSASGTASTSCCSASR